MLPLNPMLLALALAVPALSPADVPTGAATTHQAVAEAEVAPPAKADGDKSGSQPVDKEEKRDERKEKAKDRKDKKDDEKKGDDDAPAGAVGDTGSAEKAVGGDRGEF